ncbi:MAG: SDR family oxidoreductase [Dehalococcoidia bacterium]
MAVWRRARDARQINAGVLTFGPAATLARTNHRLEATVDLGGKVAIVTGGARGIGEGIATCLARAGAAVAILDLDGEQAKATAAALGPQHLGLGCDVAEEAAARPVVEEVVARLGRLDILANNAGAGRGPMPMDLGDRRWGGGITSVEQASWDETLSQNLRTTFVMTKLCVPHLQANGGAIVNIASIAGISASPSLAAYAAAKAGVISFTRSMALELAANDIRVNSILPGFLWTRAWQGMATAIRDGNPALANVEPRDIFLNAVKQSVPLKREQTPEDIGNLAAFLASDLARNITGQGHFGRRRDHAEVAAGQVRSEGVGSGNLEQGRRAMPRLEPLTPDSMTPDQRRVADAITSGPRGGMQGPFQAWLRSPGLCDPAQQLGAHVRFGTALAKDTSEMVILLAGQRWQAQFEFWAHSRLGRAAGLSDAVIDAIRAGEVPDLPRDDMRIAYTVVQELFATNRVSAATYAQAIAVLGEQGLVDLVGTVGYYTLVSLTLNTFDVGLPEGEFPPFPEPQ